VVLTIHDHPPPRDIPRYYVYRSAYKVLIEGTARRSDRVAVHHHDAKEYFRGIGIPEENLAVIPMGMDPRIFHPSPNQRQDHCLFVGALTKRKGVHYLLQALARVEGLRCVIVGDGPERAAIVKGVQQLGLADRVRLAGVINDRKQMAEAYNSASFLVLPSVSEGLPFAILEAIACGLPILATALPGFQGAVRDGYNGLLLPARDVDALADRMRILADSPELRSKMGERSVAISKDFTMQMTAEKMLRLYEGLLARGPR